LLETMAGRFLHDERYAEALFNLDDPRRPGWSLHRVLGRPLRPFSMWHKFQLEYANSPFLTGGPVTVPDLELAVSICRSPYPIRGDFPRRSGLAKILWMLWAERVDVFTARDAFHEYLADYHSPPKLWETKSKKGGRRDVDDSLEEVTLYRSTTGCTLEEAWNKPTGMLLWENILHARRQGAEVKVFTPMDERAFAAQLKKRAETIERLTNEIMEKESLGPKEARAKAVKFYWDTVNKNKRRNGFK